MTGPAAGTAFALGSLLGSDAGAGGWAMRAGDAARAASSFDGGTVTTCVESGSTSHVSATSSGAVVAGSTLTDGISNVRDCGTTRAAGNVGSRPPSVAGGGTGIPFGRSVSDTFDVLGPLAGAACLGSVGFGSVSFGSVGFGSVGFGSVGFGSACSTLARRDPLGLSLDHSLLALEAACAGRVSLGARGTDGISVAGGPVPLARRCRGSGGGTTLGWLGADGAARAAGSVGFGATAPTPVAPEGGEALGEGFTRWTGSGG
jgi:hypothetical protein